MYKGKKNPQYKKQKDTVITACLFFWQRNNCVPNSYFKSYCLADVNIYS